MLEQRRLERLVSQFRERVICAICDKAFTPIQDAELLYAGAFPVGFLCPECFANPRQAAHCIRKRARMIRSLAKEARDTVSRPEWLTLLQLAHSRANYWEGLARRIEKLTDCNSISDPYKVEKDRIPG
jgi:hypothetical protein